MVYILPLPYFPLVEKVAGPILLGLPSSEPGPPGFEAPEPKGCQYVLGRVQTEWRYCGKPIARGSYCAEHYRRCHALKGTPEYRAAVRTIADCVRLACRLGFSGFAGRARRRD